MATVKAPLTLLDKSVQQSPSAPQIPGIAVPGARLSTQTAQGLDTAPLTQPAPGPSPLPHIAPAQTTSKPLRSVSPNVKAATAALTVGASKAEVIERLLDAEPPTKPLQRAIRQFLPSWWPAPSPSEKGAPTAKSTRMPKRTPSADAEKIQAILEAFKATRYSDTPKVVPGMLDALRFFRDNNAHVIFCTNANALKVSQEWSSIVRGHWQNLTGLQVTDERKLTHIYHRDTQTNTSTRATAAQAADWDKIWNNLHDGIQTDRAAEGFRIDIMGKCGKGKLPASYPDTKPDVHLNPTNLAKLGVTRQDTLYFVGNEIKDAAAARYLADQGFNVQFYFLNDSELPEAIDYLEQHITEQAEDHPDHEEAVQLLAHCKRWDLAHWPAAQRVSDGHALMQAIAPVLANTPEPKVLMDFHGTISDQIQTLTDLVDAATPPASPGPR